MELIKLIITANEDFVLFSPPDVKQNYLLLLAKLNLFRSRLNKDVLLAMTRLNPTNLVSQDVSLQNVSLSPQKTVYTKL